MYNQFNGRWEMDPPQMMQMQSQPRQQIPMPVPMQKHEVVWVTGLQGANALQMPPEDAMLALDNSAPILYFIKTDSAGYKTPTAFDLVPHITEEEKQQQTMAEKMDMLFKKIEELEEKVNGKSNRRSDGQGRKQSNAERPDGDGQDGA